MAKYDDKIELSVDRITRNLTIAEGKYLEIAGKRLIKIYAMSKEKLQGYLLSGEFLHDIKSDMRKTERWLNIANSENRKHIKGFEKDIVGIVYNDADELVKKRDIKKAVNQ